MITPAEGQPAATAGTIAAQQAFKALMRAMAEPGHVGRLVLPAGVPPQLPAGLAAVAVTLADFETPVWLDPDLAKETGVVDYLRFATGAPIIADPAGAAFALVRDAAALPPFSHFGQGSDAYPDGSTTIVTEVRNLGLNRVYELSGPGIAGRRTLAAGPLPEDFPDRMRANRALFPRGIDLVLTCADEVVCLPRSVRLAAG